MQSERARGNARDSRYAVEARDQAEGGVRSTIDISSPHIGDRQPATVRVRDQRIICDDPPKVFGIAPIRVVAEQRVQAIAFGLVDEVPQIVTNWNPLSRESGNLDPFAEALNDYLQISISTDQIPRIWLPHRAAVDVIDILDIVIEPTPKPATGCGEWVPNVAPSSKKQRTAANR